MPEVSSFDYFHLFHLAQEHGKTLKARGLRVLLCHRGSSKFGSGTLDHSWVASNWVEGSGGGMIVSDCPDTVITNSIFAANGALRGERTTREIFKAELYMLQVA